MQLFRQKILKVSQYDDTDMYQATLKQHLKLSS